MALCAVAQGLVTFQLIHAKPDSTTLCLLFASTLGTYNFCILIAKQKHPQDSPYIRVRWYYRHYRLVVSLTIVSLLSLVPLFFLVSMESRVLLIFLSALSFGYGLPLFMVGDQKFGLRNIPGLKQLLITLVWTMSCVLLPILQAEHLHLAQISLKETTELIAKQFLFYGALTILFDIRDLYDDTKTGLKTIPVAWGEKNAYIFCQVALAGYLLLLLIFRKDGFDNNFYALAITIVITAWLVFKSKWEKNEYYYFFFIDGILIMQYLLLLAFKYV